MRDFDLEAALNGAPVQTRNGEQVTQLHLFDIDSPRPLFGIRSGEISGWCKNGDYWLDGEESVADLFMVPTKREGWVARTNSSTGPSYMEVEIYASEDDCRVEYPDADSYHKIEWEE